MKSLQEPGDQDSLSVLWRAYRASIGNSLCAVGQLLSVLLVLIDRYTHDIVNRALCLTYGQVLMRFQREQNTEEDHQNLLWECGKLAICFYISRSYSIFFRFLKILTIFFISAVSVVPHGRKKSKMLLPQIASEVFKTSADFSILKKVLIKLMLQILKFHGI